MLMNSIAIEEPVNRGRAVELRRQTDERIECRKWGQIARMEAYAFRRRYPVQP
jgi:hypothetical protein